ncbi:murein DD-endopeptidase MepM/ murein hydrolase activator NlpD [Glaciihabitans tibetensis]|uniref:Murein DD-endopeptidase MepM/ murein hydrolase activator NlpD n=1 Tax=Glaciihabitans tibetensis TaxID=1266600 RepID=A0A2T0VB90_9MICO|nr:M23 family metallopeptidase [Glaciihabitans tibetensis]PRY67424.1 murein DD-endopeptidase MepM/ murein hydrolase activator NlpD [Glaciihabitans tibetensis]
MSLQSSASPRAPRWSRARRVIALLSVVGVLATGAVVTTEVSPAWAIDYPSWSDVEAARADQAASQAQVTEIQALLAQLESELAAAQADAEAKGTAYQEAEQEYFEATVTAGELRAKADAAAAVAVESQTRAGQLAAQLARTGSNDLTLNLLLNGEDVEDMLATMGQAGKVSEQANEIYEKAVQDKNAAQSLTDQADVAAGVLEGLKADAAAAFEVAQVASVAAADTVAVSAVHKDELEAQLASLTSAVATTEAQYQAGVVERARIAAAEEAARVAAARAEAAAAAAAAASSGGGGGGGGAVGGSTVPGAVNGNGWAKPANGSISSGYGYRIHPVSGGSRLHSGTDLAGGCGIPIYAAHSGTVQYAGVYGTYGNWVLINNGDGISTGYAHIVNGGIRVAVGQQVAAGDVIAYVGSTGASTGCHLHFEVRVNGVATNAVPYMRNVGITLG